MKHLVTINRVDFVAIMEPFVSKDKVEGYMRFLGFHNCIANENGKIWCFWTIGCQTTIAANEEQQITVNFKDNTDEVGVFVNVVYAKSSSNERRDLWHSLEITSNMVIGPLCVGGDFSAILDAEEKLGGRPYRASRSFDFASCIQHCDLVDAGYIRATHTWCNNSNAKEKNMEKVGQDLDQ